MIGVGVYLTLKFFGTSAPEDPLCASKSQATQSLLTAEIEALQERDLEQVSWGRLGEHLSLELSCVNRQTPKGQSVFLWKDRGGWDRSIRRM